MSFFFNHPVILDAKTSNIWITFGREKDMPVTLLAQPFNQGQLVCKVSTLTNHLLHVYFPVGRHGLFSIDKAAFHKDFGHAFWLAHPTFPNSCNSVLCWKPVSLGEVGKISVLVNCTLQVLKSLLLEDPFFLSLRSLHIASWPVESLASCNMGQCTTGPPPGSGLGFNMTSL
jgi:hypothetical protein